jgi:predicted component of type VI protein secretion system
MDARLRVLSGPHAGERIPVQRGKLLIGREEDCHLRPDSEFVSRHHCVLLLDDYTLRIRDLGSKNGTFVNGRRIGSGDTILLHDDMISIGEMICQIDLAQPEPIKPPLVSEKQGKSVSTMMQGTAVFDGDTVQSSNPSIVLPADVLQAPVPAPLGPAAPPADPNEETQLGSAPPEH